MHVLLHGFATRCGNVKTAAKKGRQLAAIAALGLLDGNREPLQNTSPIFKAI